MRKGIRTIGIMAICLMILYHQTAVAQHLNNAGKVIGYYKGVEVYSNGLNTGTGNGNPNYQCVAFVIRFYKKVYNVQIKGHGWGNANNFFNSHDGRFIGYRNNGTVPPGVDQILCYGGGKNGYGHVAIITEVNISAGYIVIVDQNRTSYPDKVFLKVPLKVNNDRYYISNKGLGSSYYVQGWLGLGPGMFSDGWHPGVSEKFVQAYNANGGASGIGSPIDNGKGLFVHYWPDKNGNPNQPGSPDACLVQDFRTPSGLWLQLVMNAVGSQVYPVLNQILIFWHNNKGYQNYGPPMGNEFALNYAGTKYGQKGDRLVVQKFCKLQELKRRTIVYNTRTGSLGHFPVGIFEIKGPAGALCYHYENGNWVRWPNNYTKAPTGQWIIDAGQHNFWLKNENGHTLASFSLHAIEGNHQNADPSPSIPSLSVSPTSLDFGTSANQKSFDISSNTNWSISDNRNWISCTPTSGSGDKTINVSINRSGLSAGTHSGKITISSSNAGTKTVNVNLAKEETPPPNNFCLALEAEDMSATTGAVWGDYRIIWSNGEIYKRVDFPQSQTYEFEVKAKGDYAHGAWPNMELRIDNSVKGSKAVSSNNWNDYTLLVNVPAGSHKVAIAFTNDYYDPGQEDRNLYVDRIKISSSGSNPPPPPPTNNNLIVNGDFSQGRNSWQLEVHPGCAAGWRIKNNALKINVDRLTSGASSHPYRVQVKQVVTQLKPNTHYKLSFKYKGTIPWLAVTISKNQPDWTDVGFYKTINVSSSWRTREFSFKTKPDVISNNKLNFQIGSGLGEFWLDEVVLEEETSSNPSPSPPPLNLILVNEDFNNGLGVFKKEIHIYQNADIYQQGGNAVIKVKKAGNFYEVQLKTFIPTETGRKYALEFKAKANRSHKIYLQLSKDTSPWTYYGFWQEVKLSTSWQTYSYEFTSNHTDNRARLTFHAGAEIGKVYLDYVKIKKISLSRPNLITETEINPKEFFLFQNYPNPFNASTVVKFTLAQAQHITLAIFNILGKKVITLVDKELEPGNYQVSWNGRDDQGNEMASGIYLCLLQAGKWVKVKKMTLLR